MVSPFTQMMDETSLQLKYNVLGIQTQLPRVVLLPAYDANADDYLPFAEAISAETQIVIPDVWRKKPTSGVSLAEYVAHFGSSQLSPNRWILLGHNLGGTLALLTSSFASSYKNDSLNQQPLQVTVYQPWLPLQPSESSYFPHFQKGMQALKRFANHRVAAHDALIYSDYGLHTSQNIAIVTKGCSDPNRYLLHGWTARHFPNAVITNSGCEHGFTKSWVQDSLAHILLAELNSLKTKE